jgi:hypothetical protein
VRRFEFGAANARRASGSAISRFANYVSSSVVPPTGNKQKKAKIASSRASGWRSPSPAKLVAAISRLAIRRLVEEPGEISCGFRLGGFCRAHDLVWLPRRRRSDGACCAVRAARPRGWAWAAQSSPPTRRVCRRSAAMPRYSPIRNRRAVGSPRSNASVLNQTLHAICAREGVRQAAGVFHGKQSAQAYLDLITSLFPGTAQEH